MAIHQILETLTELKLIGMKQALYQQQSHPAMQAQPFDERFGMLVYAEQHCREQKRQDRLLRMARLKHSTACVEEVDYQASRGVDRLYFAGLTQCNWITQHQHLLVTGPTGVGKTWLSCALAQQAVRLGFPVLFKRFPLLCEELDIAKRDGSLPKLRQQLTKVSLLVLDDWGAAPLSSVARYELLELIEARSGTGSLLITSQFPVDQWHSYIGELTVADAIMDRLIHRSHRLELHGDSLRKTYSKAEGQHHE